MRMHRSAVPTQHLRKSRSSFEREVDNIRASEPLFDPVADFETRVKALIALS
jgi:hypothetical protein